MLIFNLCVGIQCWSVVEELDTHPEWTSDLILMWLGSKMQPSSCHWLFVMDIIYFVWSCAKGLILSKSQWCGSYSHCELRLKGNNKAFLFTATISAAESGGSEQLIVHDGFLPPFASDSLWDQRLYTHFTHTLFPHWCPIYVDFRFAITFMWASVLKWVNPVVLWIEKIPNSWKTVYFRIIAQCWCVTNEKEDCSSSDNLAWVVVVCCHF